MKRKCNEKKHKQKDVLSFSFGIYLRLSKLRQQIMSNMKKKKLWTKKDKQKYFYARENPTYMEYILFPLRSIFTSKTCASFQPWKYSDFVSWSSKHAFEYIINVENLKCFFFPSCAFEIWSLVGIFNVPVILFQWSGLEKKKYTEIPYSHKHQTKWKCMAIWMFKHEISPLHVRHKKRQVLSICTNTENKASKRINEIRKSLPT